jgi:peptidoglycan/xylan/chitin deacetylase (PgdA/CDA1 family)
MLHRFADPATGRPGHDVDALRADLQWLRRHRFTVLPLRTLVERLQAGEPVFKTVAFTVDDGYADFASRALPAFVEFECPVTVFLTTGFVDGHCWMWWDVVEYLVTRTSREGVRVDAGTEAWTYAWRDAREQGRVVLDLVERLKAVPEDVKRDVLARLATVLEVDVPAQPTPAYAPLTWDEVRRCAASGVSFGPHSLTHPILARTDVVQAATEIAGSWQRLQQMLGSVAVPVFCYPNGDPGSFGVREQELVARAGLTAAVSTVPGYAGAGHLDPRTPLRRFEVPRMAYVQADRSFVQVSSGLQRAKDAMRAVRRPGATR